MRGPRVTWCTKYKSTETSRPTTGAKCDRTLNCIMQWMLETHFFPKTKSLFSNQFMKIGVSHASLLEVAVGSVQRWRTGLRPLRPSLQSSLLTHAVKYGCTWKRGMKMLRNCDFGWHRWGPLIAQRSEDNVRVGLVPLALARCALAHLVPVVHQVVVVVCYPKVSKFTR